MSKENTQNKPDPMELEPLLIEDLIVDNLQVRRDVIKFVTKDGKEVMKRVAYRKLTYGEITQLRKATQEDDTYETYYKHLIFMASIEPNFSGLNIHPQLPWGFIRSYGRKIDKFMLEDDFL